MIPLSNGKADVPLSKYPQLLLSSTGISKTAVPAQEELIKT